MKLKFTVIALSAVVLIALGCNKTEQTKDLQKNAGADVKQPATPIKTAAISGAYGTYTMVNVGSGFAAEVGGFTTLGQKQDNQRAIQQWSASTTTPERWQKWNVVDLGTGYYKIVNLYSGKVLDAPNSSQGTVLTQYDWHGGTNQQWQLVVVGFGAYKIINRSNGLALTNENGSTTNGTAITQRTFVNDSSQWWVFNQFARDSYRDNELTNFFKRTTGSTAFDGVFSIPLTYGANNGKVMWPTNDTYWNNINADGSTPCYGGDQPIAYRCSNLIQPAQSNGVWNFSPSATSNITTSYGNQFFPIQPGTSWTWPSGGIEIGSHVYVYADEGNGLDPTSEGIYDIYQGNAPSYTVTRLNTPALSNQTTIRYMHGMVKVTDGGVNYVYVYGANGGDVYVARFPESSPSSWTFWNGSSWASNPTTGASAKIASVPNGGFGVAKVNGKYVIASMDYGFGCDFAQRNVYTCFSADPKSGWSTNKVVYSMPDYKQGHTPYFYQAAIHPQFNSNNEMVFTYCVNFYGSCLTPCSNANGTMDPNDYRAKAVRIPYDLIGI
ncbi:RICIN domain-containing protein [Mucilaginibacter sp. 21P]|uniref:RICIN domain-containing protein n=1 Tax=Mucilaginibacter sp. 21P TaxID=2778902 RepID=UPI001C5678B8|nr:RICIN domain-containing protein [Mucilaginibacter sp. 21P]QXV65252.1 RICIN domain-containing protein [Mucilaginibacter sp. 21P]